VVYESRTANGTTTVTVQQGRNQVITTARHQPARPGQNPPYPVQPAMPLPQPVQQNPQYPYHSPVPGPGYQNQGHPPGGYAAVQTLHDLPPPYPGFARDENAFQTQPAFNPQFDDQTEHLIAAASRAAPTAPPKE